MLTKVNHRKLWCFVFVSKRTTPSVWGFRHRIPSFAHLTHRTLRESWNICILKPIHETCTCQLGTVIRLWPHATSPLGLSTQKVIIRELTTATPPKGHLYMEILIIWVRRRCGFHVIAGVYNKSPTVLSSFYAPNNAPKHPPTLCNIHHTKHHAFKDRSFWKWLDQFWLRRRMCSWNWRLFVSC